MFRRVSVAAMVVSVLVGGVVPSEAAEISVPLSIRGGAQRVERSAPQVPFWTGVPLPRGAVKDAAALRLSDRSERSVPAQFDVLARWLDGSAKWVLVSFVAPGAPSRPNEYYLTAPAPASIAATRPAKGASAFADTNNWDITTGPLKFRLNRHGFCGLSQAWLDLDGDGTYAPDELICQESPDAGIVAADAKGVVHTSHWGKVSRIDIERAGPLHVVVAVRGDLRSEGADKPLLEYVMRYHAFAGSSLVRGVLTVHNPRAAGRTEDGGRWVLGQSGSVLLESLDYVQPIRLPEGARRVSLSSEPGRLLLDRLPLTGPAGVYQDSSGGENWLARTHVNRNDVVPLEFKGYRVSYRDRTVDTGLRASPWLDVADMRWGISVAMPLFWQNFPKSLGADADGTIRLGLWPKQFADLHEIQGGEQKTHEFWLYFRHRRNIPIAGATAPPGGGFGSTGVPPVPPGGGPTTAPTTGPAGGEGGRRFGRGGGPRFTMLPLDRELMPLLLDRPLALASAQAYAQAGALDPILPVQPDRFLNYEAVMSAAVRGQVNLFVHREQQDEYGWRNFGDTPAYNERDQTQGAFAGTICLSHYNNEYDLGLGMLTQALRTADADWPLAKGWYDLAITALWHEADIDIYHCREDPVPMYNGGTFTHTAHGVDAGRSTHRASPADEMYGRLEWPWGKGGAPESGHYRNRGIVTAYLFSGDRHLLEAADDVTDGVVYKVGNDKFAQIEIPDRCAGNNLQILLDAWLLTGQQKHLDLCKKIVANLDPPAVRRRSPRALDSLDWSAALYVKTLGRYLQTLAEMGQRDPAAVAQHLEYSKLIRRPFERRASAGSGRSGGGGSWSLLLCEVMMQAADLCPDDKLERQKFLDAAAAGFHALDAYVRDGVGAFWNSKTLTMMLQGGGLYMRHALETGLEPATQPATRPAAGEPSAGPRAPTRPASERPVSPPPVGND